MSKPKFMVFKLKDLWLPVIIAILVIIAIIFFASKFTATKPTFAPENDYSDGVYLSTVSLDNAEFSIAVSVNENQIESIALENLSEEDTLMYPLFPVSMEYINKQVTKHQSFDIEEFAEAKETTQLLLSAAQDALSIAKNDPDSDTDPNPDDDPDTDSDSDPDTDSDSDADADSDSDADSDADSDDYIVSNPDMSDDMYNDWESEMDFIFEDEMEPDFE